MRILLDHNLPRQLARLFPDHDVGVAALLGWAELSNGELLRQAEAAGSECMVTGDRNIAHQQNLAGRKIALIVLNSTRRNVILPQLGVIVGALDRVVEGAFLEVTLDLPPRQRRPFIGWPLKIWPTTGVASVKFVAKPGGSVSAGRHVSNFLKCNNVFQAF